MSKLLLAATTASLMALAGCDTDSKVASRNLSKAADMFEIERRIVFLQRDHRRLHPDH